ncbi:DUF2807 domain-containing protein [Bacteroidetes/Chlorobi group bacterium ChocPot_Mid]|nr:MAG: DUF2807 domain-containing protein [Bacteroidetes/Chlorobi group bacterium ChocPot_Mid]
MKIYFIIFICVIFFSFNSCYEPIQGSGVVVRQEITGLSSFNSIILKNMAKVYVSSGSPQKVEIEVDDNFLDNVLENTSVSIKKLTISSKGIIAPSVMNVYITIPDISELTNNGSGKIIMQNSFIQGSTLWLNLTGSGNIELMDFVTTDCQITNTGSGAILIDSLGAFNTINLSLSSTGIIAINKIYSKFLQDTCSGSGRILGKSGSSMNGKYLLSGSGIIDLSGVSAVNAMASNSGSGRILLKATNKLDAKISGSGNIEYWGNPPDLTQKITGTGKLIKKN